MASAQAYAFSAGFVSAIIYNNSAGSFGLTYDSGLQSYDFEAAAFGNSSYGYYVGTDGATYIDQYGDTESGGPQGVGWTQINSDLTLGVTNLSNYSQTYTVLVDTDSYAVGSINWSAYASAFSFDSVWDSAFDASGGADGFEQYSESAVHVTNRYVDGTWFGSGSFWANYSDGLLDSQAVSYGGHYNSLSLYAEAYQFGDDYSVTVAPGETDYVYMTSTTDSDSFASLPAPAAAGPFAIGLLAALRRRQRRYPPVKPHR